MNEIETESFLHVGENVLSSGFLNNFYKTAHLSVANWAQKDLI